MPPEKKWSIKRSEHKPTANICESAGDQGSKCFRKVIKDLTNNHESETRTTDYANLFCKRLMDVTDQETVKF